MPRLTDSQILASLQSLPEDQSNGESEEIDRYQNDPEEEIHTPESSSSSSGDSDDNIPIGNYLLHSLHY